jgi:hypothetical protein
LAFNAASTANLSSSVVQLMDIARVADDTYLNLTTTGRWTGRRHTVELWFAVAHGILCLSHEGKYTDWMKNILRSPRVVFTIRGLTGSSTARLVGRGDACETGTSALYYKYYGDAGKKGIDDWFSESAVIEIAVDAN